MWGNRSPVVLLFHSTHCTCINSVLEGVFYYSGAATAAGQSYTGALLVTRDGSWPKEKHIDRVRRAFDSCGIKLWELFEVCCTTAQPTNQ